MNSPNLTSTMIYVCNYYFYFILYRIQGISVMPRNTELRDISQLPADISPSNSPSKPATQHPQQSAEPTSKVSANVSEDLGKFGFSHIQ